MFIINITIMYKTGYQKNNKMAKDDINLLLTASLQERRLARSLRW